MKRSKMTETLSTSKEKEVPKIKLGLQDKYDKEKKQESHVKRLDQDNIKGSRRRVTKPGRIQDFSFTFYTKRKN